jgi:hypothetical protein
MAEITQTPPSASEQFFEDYFRTFARFLDPNLPARPRIFNHTSGDELTRWPLGQTVAFATIVSASGWALLAGIIHFFA